MGSAGYAAAQAGASLDAASERAALPSLRQALPAGGGVAGDLPASQPVPAVTVELKRSAAQQADLDAYLKSVRTQGSAEYHHWLTPEQFAARFAPTATEVAPVTAWLATQGLQVQSVSAGGMRLTASGTAAQVASAFGVRLQRYALPTGDRVAVDGTPTVPGSLAAAVLAVGGLDQSAATSSDAVAGLEAAIDANTAAVVPVDLTGTSASVEELNAVLEQASAQGQTVVLQHVTAKELPARALVLVSGASSAADAADVTATPRPDWQVAEGLPADQLRAMPDAAVADASALTAALQQVVTKAAARQGEVAATFYTLASAKGVFTHADSTVPVGAWSAADGLGTVDPVALVKAWPFGVTSPNSTTIALSNHVVTHGSNITLTATVTGSNGTPTGTVSFGSSQGGTLGSVALDASGVATYSVSTLAGGQYGFFGTYSGDNTYASTTTNIDTATVNPEAARIVAAMSGSPAVGTVMPVTVTVSSPSGVGTPTGSVMVYPYGSAVSANTYTGTLVAGAVGSASATVSVPASNVGSFTFQANCTANASFSCGSPQAFSVTVGKGAPAFSLTQTGSATAAVLTATAAVPAGAGTGTVAPTGSVQFLDNGAVIGNGTLSSSGVATYSGALGGGATHLVTAAYVGDGNYNSATATANATVKVTPRVTLSVVTAGSSLSAVVAPPSGTSTTPTGTVQFLLGAAALGSGAVNSAGVATFSGTYGSGVLTAVYGGDGSFNTASSNAIDTAKVLPTVALVKTSTDSAANTVALSATVMNGTGVATTATGTMSFLDGTTAVGTGTVTGGVASFSGSLAAGASALAVGRLRAQATVITTHSLTAVYSGDTNFNAATSNAVTANATTTLITTSTSLSSSSGYSGPYGTAFSLISVITPSSYVTAGTAPTGTITILDGGVAVGTGTLSAGTATVAVSTLTVGTHSLTAMYGGDANYAASTSAAAVFTITPLTATIAATISPIGSIPYGYDANLAITVAAASGTVGPSGTVMATVSGSNGTYTATLLSATGSLVSTASLPLPVPSPGTYTITVKCNTNLTCNTVTLTVTTTKGFTTTTVNGVTPTSPPAGTPVTISATVANSGTGTGTYRYSGTVSFYSNNKFLGSGSVVNGLATATVVFLSASTQSVTAIYSGDANWTGSTSDPVSVTPTPIPAAIVLSSNTLSGIVGQNITLTAAVSSGVTNSTLVPGGTVAFYDTFQGVVVNLGSAAVLSNGLNNGYAQLSTTGLRAGSHSIMAVYSGDLVFLKTTSSNLLVNIGDFALSFVPSSLSVSSGGTAKGVLTVTGLNGFSGAIALGCSTSAGTETSCSVSPTVVNTGGTAQITVSTTKNSAALVRVAEAGVLFGLCLVRRRRRLVALLSLLLVVVIAGGGCSQVAATDSTASGSGTPLGTMSLTITAASTDAPVNARHTYVIPVTVQ
ncbi:putative protease [Terriglobus roseus DSM 18391]|uniref:Putative protease n=1 Tax=Terriglobus roseus (strain DSM 18391 / NRRL B-41598 / KBS 63) TaxID=926566 RepID=I3ZEM5_TERRK|nr:putative protease [Terriglobus roseus DSM 18391]